MAKDASGPGAAFVESNTITADFCIIGAGAGGIAVAMTAAALGQKVILIEKHKIGGDSLSYAGLPSKALLAAAKRAHAMRQAALFGIQGVEPRIDHRAIRDHVQGAVAAAALNYSIERFTGLGIQVITAAGKFVDKSTVVAGGQRITARWFVIATGSSPVAPPIAGLADVPYFTNETIFDTGEPLPHLLILGADGAALEIAQAYHRLGSKVTVVDKGTALADDDPELSSIVLRRLRMEGITILERTIVTGVAGGQDNIVATISRDGVSEETLSATHIVVAGERRANTADLGLSEAGIALDRKNIRVDAGLRTRNARVFAIGDVTGGIRATHTATSHAEIVIRRALFRWPAATSYRSAARVTFTDPELAHVGLTEAEARARYGKIKVLRWPYYENDKAQAERETDGHIKVVTSKSGLILGASIAGADASEIIQVWSLALAQKLKIKAMTGWTSPYPTLSEINKRAAYCSFATVAGNPLVRKIIALLAKLG
jgi:pyruvate/2-oxoglutarate dehydrogenase complex dihydrolipoamide dehydrogenase (E3) component